MSLEKFNHFYSLTPNVVLDSVEKQGFCPTGRYTQLNSYENRVFCIEFEDQKNFELITKFYRPGRWSKEAVKEEHSFLFELQDTGIPVVSPLILENKSSIFQLNNMNACLFPKFHGRIPQELNNEELKQIGRLLARIHNVGTQSVAQNRPFLDVEFYGDANLNLIEPIILPELKKRYLTAADNILNFLEERLSEETYIRIHGDCHKGNLLQTDPIGKPKEFFFVDFDDFCNGPPVYDFWMLFSGDHEASETNALLSGYTELREFNLKSLEIINALRGLRMIYYSGWIIKRWNDPSFKKIFENFNTYNYWAEETEALEKISWSC